MYVCMTVFILNVDFNDAVTYILHHYKRYWLLLTKAILCIDEILQVLTVRMVQVILFNYERKSF